MTPTLLTAALLAGAPLAASPNGQLGGLFDGLFGDAPAPVRPDPVRRTPVQSGSGWTIESGSGRVQSGSVIRHGFDPLPPGAYDNPPRFRPESGSGRMQRRVESGSTIQFGSGQSNDRADEYFSALSEEERTQMNRELRREQQKAQRALERELKAPNAAAESGSGVSRSDRRPEQTSTRSLEPLLTAPPPRPRVAQPAPRDGRSLGGGFDVEELPPPSEADAPPPPADARVHALLVALGWIAALVLGGAAGYLLGAGRGSNRHLRSLEPRQLDLAGEVAETADSLMAAAGAEEAGRYHACVDRLRERVGRTAVLLDDRASHAVQNLVAAASAGPPTEAGTDRDARLQAAYDGLVQALRKSVRGA